MGTMQNELLECLGEDFLESNNPFENYRKTVVTTTAYLLGVDDEILVDEAKFDAIVYDKLKNDVDSKTIRLLCELRSQFLRNYKNIDDARKYEMRSLEQMPEYLNVESIKYLREKGYEINIPNAKSPTVNIAYINQYILENIHTIKKLMPEWVKFQYIKEIFLMPGCYAGYNGIDIKNNYKKIYNNIHNEGKRYAAKRNSYPFQMYLTWPITLKETYGNILYNDYKFLNHLYNAYGDTFQAGKYVIDAKEKTKDNIYDFIENSTNIAIFVDCENVDPYAFGATILNLKGEMIAKIKKVILYNDINTSAAWNYIEDVINIPLIKKDIERVLDSKSLVDITMAAGVCEEYYKNNTESIILVSSDSDFWGLIRQLPEAHFLVLNEANKTSMAIIKKMDTNNIHHCFMSDFAQDKIQKFKTEVLYLGLVDKIKIFNTTGVFESLDVEELLKGLFYKAGIGGAEGQIRKEKEAFFNKYLKGGLLLKPILEANKMTFKIEMYRK